MSGSVPIVIIVIAGILVAVALIALIFWRKGKFEQLIIRHKKVFFAQWIIGLILALTAAFFMFDGDILGENTSGISTVIGIVGICLIATSNINLLPQRRK